MSEKNTYNLFKKGIEGKAVRIDRIENVRVDGMPDVNVCVEGIESWVEIKSPKEPVRINTPLFGSNHKLSQAQLNWFMRQAQAGGKAFILIRSDKRMLLVKGVYADEINSLTITQIMILCSFSAPVPTPAEHWQQLKRILKNGS